MQPFTIALPSKGAIAEPTYAFLKNSGLKVRKPNPRQYTGSIPAVPGLNVLFQRVKDVVYKVADGTAQIGITGLDVVAEYPDEEVIVIHDHLGFGHCDLIVAVPETWVDVETVADLVDVALDFREEKHRNLRVATTYANMTRQFFHSQGIHHFTLVKADGAIEAAPTIGYADVVVDLTQTGTTLRENHLRPLPDGVILQSQACLIGNRAALTQRPDLLAQVRMLLEHIDAALQGRQYAQLTVNIQGKTADAVAATIARNPATSGLLGPTISPVFSGDSTHWFTATITVPEDQLLNAVDFLRQIGGSHIVAQPVSYVFMDESLTFSRLLSQLGLSG